MTVRITAAPFAGVSPGALTPERAAKLWTAAKDFEAMAVGALLQPMFDTVSDTGGAFGGGAGEAAWRPMLVQAIGKQVAERGGLGLAQPVYEALVRAQAAREVTQ